MDEKLLIPLLSGGSVLAFVIIFAVLFGYFSKRSIRTGLAECIATLGLTVHEQQCGMEKPIFWYKGTYNGREYWLTFVTHHSRGQRYVQPVVFMASSNKNARLIFEQLKMHISSNANFLTRAIEKITDGMINTFTKNQIPDLNQTVFVSSFVLVGPFEKFFPKEQFVFINFKKVPVSPAPFQAPGKTVIRVQLNGMPPRPQKVIAALEAMVNSGV